MMCKDLGYATNAALEPLKPLSRALIDDKAPLGPCQGPDLRPESLQKVPWIATKSALDHDNDGRPPLPACMRRSTVLALPGTRPPLQTVD